jgi:ABC-type multidrug transport system fused ATPase/permease subunit
MDSNPTQIYRQRCETFGAERDLLQRRSNRNGDLNLILVLAALVALVAAAFLAQPVLYWLAAILGVGFVVSFIHHDRLRGRLARVSTRFDLNNEGRHRLARNWSALPNPLPLDPPPADDVALDPYTVADLDLLGSASLGHLLGTPNTPIGQATLRSWILHPASPDVVDQRQHAVDELAPFVDFREEVGLRGRLMGQTQTDFEAFIAWAERPGWLHSRPWLIWLARTLTVITLGLAVAYGLGQPVYPVLVGVLILNLALMGTAGRRVSAEINAVMARQGIFHAYAEIFQLLEAQPVTAQALRHLQSQLRAGDLGADEQMRRLGRLMPLVEIRRWVFFFFVEWPTLWSFHALWLLENWRRDAGDHVRSWLTALGEAEALIALATLRHDHPLWVFPHLTAGETRMDGRDLAHPLLPPDRAVGNNVTVGPPGTFLLVTGSNMSGKSTLLRALGVNTVLAQMGGPVCAAEMHLPATLTVASSMRVQDSLSQGVSYFMAELRRLKEIVDRVDAHQDQPDRPILFLLDEILQGTNTGERQIAARRIILHLVESGAIGAVSTHDLTLADAPAIAAAAVPVHFSERFERSADGPTMTFDYQLRPGIATSTNALKLMEVVGLPMEDC